MRIAILGQTGYVGSYVKKTIEERGHQPIQILRSATNIYNSEILGHTLSMAQVDYLINCAGYTGKPNVDACEKDKAECLKANTVLPGVIAQACNKAKINWGHVGSGCIYAGKPNNQGYTEEDAPNFRFGTKSSWYSGTKALAETILADYDNCHLWRIRMPYSRNSSSRNIIDKIMEYDQLLDSENSLSELEEISEVMVKAAEERFPTGIYNLTQPGSVTTRRIVQLIKDVTGCTKDYKFFDSEEDFMKIIKTPRSSCVLDSAKINSLTKLTPVEDSLRNILQSYIPTPTH